MSSGRSILESLPFSTTISPFTIARGFDLQNPCCDGLEIGTKMDRTFQHHQPISFHLNPEMLKHGSIHTLETFMTDDYSDICLRVYQS